MQGEPIKSREQLAAPDGWEWTQDWVIDSNRAVDENGMLFQMIFLPWTIELSGSDVFNIVWELLNAYCFVSRFRIHG